MSDVPSRALRDTLRDQLERSSSGCLDAETLAAWCDGTLSRNDRAIAESHAATCARCQAMLAAMATTAPPVAPRRWWQTATVRWLVPVAAVSSLAIAVWVNRAPEPPTARLQFEPPASSVPAAVSEAPPVRERAKQERDERSAAETSPPAALEAPSAKSAVEPTTAEAAPVPPPVALAAPAPAPPPPAASPAAPPALRSVAPSAAENVVIAPRQAFADRVAAPLAIQSPWQDVRWRIVAGVTVERSTDGGSRWQAQSTGATGRLTAGAAPSRTICWLVGAGGVVLLSKDGQTWQRVAFSEAVDLVAIRALDDSRATVTTADGREFTTTDGGTTWR
jgi:photosynthesis system II assembly factor YCF48-like protein